METPTESIERTMIRLRARLARQNTRWTRFSWCNPDQTQSQFIAECERHQSQSTAI